MRIKNVLFLGRRLLVVFLRSELLLILQRNVVLYRKKPFCRTGSTLRQQPPGQGWKVKSFVVLKLLQPAALLALNCILQLWISGRTPLFFNTLHFSYPSNVCHTELGKEGYVKVRCMSFAGWQFPPRRGDFHGDHFKENLVLLCSCMSCTDRLSLFWSPRTCVMVRCF